MSSELSVKLTINERDVIKAILEFCELRGLHIAQLSLERETGVINGGYSDDLLFLRQLILDGQWDNALDFVEPLKVIKTFDFTTFRYNLTKYKYFELLCVKLEPGPLHDNDFAVEELVECLKDLEHICPSPEDYRHLCALLTLPKLSDHEDFHNWNPSSARVQCFHKVVHLIEPLLPPTGKEKERGSQENAVNDRLFSLLTKGLFYEGCVDYCQAQAIGDVRGIEAGAHPTSLLSKRARLSSTDLSLVSWLEMVGKEQFATPFKQKQLQTHVENIRRPKLDAQWTETIMATPIKPDGHFPHNLVPKSRLKFAEKMSKSMTMSMLPNNGMLNSTFLGVAPTHPMSQSTAPGFCLGGESNINPDAMTQSQLITEMLENSSLSKTSRPDTLPVTSVTNNLMSLSMAPQLLSLSMSQTGQVSQARKVLDQMTKRTGPSKRGESRLASVAEGSTPTQEENVMSQSVLFQQFSTKQVAEARRDERVMQPMYQNGQATQQQMLVSRPQSMVLPPNGYTQPAPASFPSFQEPVQCVPTVPQPPSSYGNPYGAPPASTRPVSMPSSSSIASPLQFVPFCRYEDAQAIRAASFHPSGRYFAIGTNSKQLHICTYPDSKSVRPNEPPRNAHIALSRPKQHRGSVYCLSFNRSGDLLATGSNDKTLRLMAFNAETCKIGVEMEFSHHDGTIRDVIFLEDSMSRTSKLVSGGAGSCNINLTDCGTGQLVANLKAHSAPILGLYPWGQHFVSCSQDKSIKFWDIRAPQAINVLSPQHSNSHAAPVTSVCVDPSGRLLVSGHEDASVALFDISGNRLLQTFRPHGDEVRTVRFSNAAYYLLSASYDKRMVVTDMRGDLSAPLMYLPVAEHSDKVIQCRWHPSEFSFLSTSADRTAVLWALPSTRFR